MNRITNSDKESFSIYKFLEKNIGSCLSWAVTIAWLMFIFCKIYNGIMPKSLNEFGDFVAGAFAPLAFFWLVRGFYQQGQGLEQNSEALRLQALELQSSTKALNDQVIEQRNLLAVTNDEIKINTDKNEFEKFVQLKQFQPFFHIDDLKIDTYGVNDSIITELVISFAISNSRAMCRNVCFGYNFVDESSSDSLFKHPGFSILSGTSEYKKINLSLRQLPEFDENNERHMILRVTYTDSLDNHQYQCIKLFLEKKESIIRLKFYQMGDQTMYHHV